MSIGNDSCSIKFEYATQKKYYFQLNLRIAPEKDVRTRGLRTILTRGKVDSLTKKSARKNDGIAVPENDPLRQPIQYVKGVGPRRAPLLEKLGLRTAVDILFFFPRDYEDLTDRRPYDAIEEGVLQTVQGTVVEFESRTTGGGKNLLGVLIEVDGGFVRGIWFNMPFMAKKFRAGQKVLMSGKPKSDGMYWQISHPRTVILSDDEADQPGTEPAPFLPIYPLTEGLRQPDMRRITRKVVDSHASLLQETFPVEFLKSHDLAPIVDATRAIHFPESKEELEFARRRFVYQELFILQLGLAVRRERTRRLERAPELETTPVVNSRIRRLFPFELTSAQERAIEEVRTDMGSSNPMNRLLQGDVGSGKTIVAVYAMLLAVAHGRQAVLMAPTEVLARQHARTLKSLLAMSPIGERTRIAELVGGLPAKRRAEVLNDILSGHAQIIVGTQAVIQESVRFHKLGLVVIDEQHKFGVRQRAALKDANTDAASKTVGAPDAESSRTSSPHYLVMTATPIPRSMTMTLFGDLDVSIIDELPPGRKPVQTHLVPEEKRDDWWKFFGERLREGRQGYVVVPLVEESENYDATSLQEAYEELTNGPLEAFRLGLLHGRMSSDEKDAIMADFRSGEIQVLVCTTVIEVGVDVPNATVMAIENAERFGIAQLHQLRGRIGRGSYQGICGVFSSTESDDGQKRLKAFTSTNDGFKLAELDFEIRGPGEVLGAKQHGMPPFRIADLIRDMEILREARRDAIALVESDPGLSKEQNARLRRMVLTRYGQVLELGDVG